MQNKSHFSMNIGLPSILLIFVILCLVSFGILSLISANSDKKLSEKILNRSSNYYNACNQAEELLADLNNQLLTIYSASTDESAYWQVVQNIPTHYCFTLSNIQNLDITLTFFYPQSADDSFFCIDSWKVVTSSNLEYDEQLHIIP